jgi:hypothetical protein
MAISPINDLDDDPVAARGPDGRWPTLDGAEQAIRWPGTYRATGAFRQALLDRRSSAQDELDSVDRELAEAMTRRRRLVERIEGCNLALVGTGEIRHHLTDDLLQVMRWHRRIPFRDAMPPVDERAALVISGRRLAAATTALLRATGQTLGLAEIERLLRLQDLIPAGRSSQSISDALRGEVRAGRVERVRRGWYRAA